jgi:hypothetical protein
MTQQCLITYNNKTAYRGEVGDLTVWRQDNNLSLNASKTKELFVDYRKRRAKHAPGNIDGVEVERVERFKFLGVHITNELSWSIHTKTVVKRARLTFLKGFGMGPKILKKLNSCTI